MKSFLSRFPRISAVLLVVADVVLAVLVGLVATAVVPAIPKLPDFIALCVLAAATAILVTILGWWRVVGWNGPAQWRHLWLLLLPALLVFLPRAVHPPAPLSLNCRAFKTGPP
jgi:hypothetical protein